MSLLHDIKHLAGRSVIYGLGSVLGRSITFLLLPLYTRFLTPAEYGVVAVSGTITAVLGIVLPLGLHGAVAKYYFATGDPAERKRKNGTLWVAIVLAAFTFAVVLDHYGGRLFAWLVPQVPFAPYVRLAIWTAFFGVFGLVPLAVLQVEERPFAYVSATLATAIGSAALVVVFVVVRHEGAYGYLLGICVSAGAAAIGYSIWAIKRFAPAIDAATLRLALAFSLPLVPHGLAGWVLDVSDRVLLERFVPAADIGLYALGFQFGAIANMLATAMNSAWVPFVYKRVAMSGTDARASLARLATLFAAVMCAAAVALALLGRDAVELLMSPSFRGAGPVIPWIVGGYVFAGLYFVPSNFLFVAERTSLIPLVTIAAGILNVLLNLWLMPRYGMMAAAWTTFGTYAVTLLLTWGVAQRVFHVPYEYGRVVRAALAALALFWLGELAGHGTGRAVIIHIALLAALPPAFLAIGIVSPEERQRVGAATRRLLLTSRG